MKLGVVCQIAGVLIFGALLLGLLGMSMMSVPFLMYGTGEIKNIVFISLSMLSVLFGSGGFLIFLLGFWRQLRSTVVHRELYIAAAVCIMISLVGGITHTVLNMGDYYEYMSFAKFLLHISNVGVWLAGGIVLVIFILCQGCRKGLVKGLAAGSLGFLVFGMILMIINTALYLKQYPIEQIQHNILNFAGYVFYVLGNLIASAAEIGFMGAFLISPYKQNETGGGDFEEDFGFRDDFIEEVPLEQNFSDF